MRTFKHFVLAIVAVAGLSISVSAASAYGPVRWAVRPVARAPVAAVRTARVVTPRYGPVIVAPRAYAPRVYVAPRVIVAPPVVVVPYGGAPSYYGPY